MTKREYRTIHIIDALERIGHPHTSEGIHTEIATLVSDITLEHTRDTLGKMARAGEIRRWLGGRRLLALYGLEGQEYPRHVNRERRVYDPAARGWR